MVIPDTGYGVHGVGSLFPERSRLVEHGDRLCIRFESAWNMKEILHYSLFVVVYLYDFDGENAEGEVEVRLWCWDEVDSLDFGSEMWRPLRK